MFGMLAITCHNVSTRWPPYPSSYASSDFLLLYGDRPKLWW